MAVPFYSCTHCKKELSNFKVVFHLHKNIQEYSQYLSREDYPRMLTIWKKKTKRNVSSIQIKIKTKKMSLPCRKIITYLSVYCTVGITGIICVCIQVLSAKSNQQARINLFSIGTTFSRKIYRQQITSTAPAALFLLTQEVPIVKEKVHQNRPRDEAIKNCNHR